MALQFQKIPAVSLLRLTFFVPLALVMGTAVYGCYLLSLPEMNRHAGARSRQVLRAEGRRDADDVKENTVTPLFTARTRFRVVRSTAPDAFGSRRDAEENVPGHTSLEEDSLVLRQELMWLDSLMRCAKKNGLPESACRCDERGVNDPIIRQLLPLYQDQVMSRRSFTAAGFGPEHPRVKALNKSITALLEQLDQPVLLHMEGIKIQLESIEQMLARANAAGGAWAAGRESWLEAQVRLISSPLVLNRVVKKLNLETRWNRAEDQAGERVEEITELEFSPGTNVVTVSVKSASQADSVDIANAVRDCYKEIRMEGNAKRKRRLSAHIKAQMEAQEKTLEAMRTGADKQPEEDNGPGESPRELSGYAATHGMQRYQSASQLLNGIRETLAREPANNAPEKLVEVIERARLIRR